MLGIIGHDSSQSTDGSWAPFVVANRLCITSNPQTWLTATFCNLNDLHNYIQLCSVFALVNVCLCMVLQVVISWQRSDGSWLQRVVTRRLSITSNLQAWLTGTDWKLASVVAAKGFVKDAQADVHSTKLADMLRRRIGTCTGRT